LRKSIAIVCCVILGNIHADVCHGQEEIPAGAGPHHYWTPRYAFGLQDSEQENFNIGYLEFGVARVGLRDNMMDGSLGFYGSVDGTQRRAYLDPRYLWGLKSGIELSWMIGIVSAEVRYVTDFETNAFLFCPKIGLSLGGFIHVTYGYNFPNAYTGIADLGHDQLQLTMNLNGKIIKNELHNEKQ
jgi:hypothetical protein